MTMKTSGRVHNICLGRCTNPSSVYIAIAGMMPSFGCCAIYVATPVRMHAQDDFYSSCAQSAGYTATKMDASTGVKIVNLTTFSAILGAKASDHDL